MRVRAYDNHKVVVEGSGFVVNEKGCVLTNAHFLAKAESLTVLSLKTGAEVVAQRVFASRSMNLALLHVQGLNLPPCRPSASPSKGLMWIPKTKVAIRRYTMHASEMVEVLCRYGARE